MTSFAETTWRELEAVAGAETDLFDRSTLKDLPPPAQRFLAAALPEHTPLHRVVRLGMDGEIKLGGRWLAFTARQILRAGVGFVWSPAIGGRFLRFTGTDALGPGGARIEFRLHGLIPVVKDSGPDVAHSAAGRLGVETAAWLPHALTPQAGARWEAIDDTRSAVTIDVADRPVRIEVAIDADGRMQWLGLARWRDSAKPPGYAPFGGTVDSALEVAGGVKIAGSGTVGWDWHTPNEPDGVFFRYRINFADFGSTNTDGRPPECRSTVATSS